MNHRIMLIFGFLACAPVNTLEIMGYNLRFSALGWGLVLLSFLLKPELLRSDFAVIGMALLALIAGFAAPLPWYIAIQGLSLGISSLLLLSGEGVFRFAYVGLLLGCGFLASAPLALPLLPAAAFFFLSAASSIAVCALLINETPEF